MMILTLYDSDVTVELSLSEDCERHLKYSEEMCCSFTHAVP